jgi:hypothetical protein
VTRLLIGNDFNGEQRNGAGWVRWGVQRLLWFARDDDVVILPVLPEESFVSYITALTGTRRDSLRIVVPPHRDPNTEIGLLIPERLADPEFQGELRAALDGRAVDEVFALWPDTSIVDLARRFGAQTAVPGHAFLSQGGGLLVNSKATFRAIAAGASVPLAVGTVCPDRCSAENAIVEMMADGEPIILKHEYFSSGKGNEILSPRDGVRPIGASRVVIAAGRPAIRNYLAEHWPRLTSGGRRPLVVERYIPNSPAFFVEFLITDDGARFTGQGEMVSAPLAAAEIIPARQLTETQLDELIAGGRRLCEPLHAIGYRGRLSADAIVTPAGEVMFTEYNGRITGSTPIYEVIGEQIVGNYQRDRTLVESVWPDDWSVSSFQHAVNALAEAGLAYCARMRTGVLLISAFDSERKAVMYCIVAEDLETAREYQDKMEPLFSSA